jgi:FKBP-type peptidyl-prolyl cis-trans isomerase
VGQLVALPSGLKYLIMREGNGPVAKAGQLVTVNYTGWLQSTDTKFDSSIDRGKPFQFTLGAGQVIPGWDEGVQGMRVGEKRKLYIPADLGYGAQGAGGVIPPNAALVFDVDLLDVQ